MQQGQSLHSGKVIKMLHGRLVQVGKTLTDLQILGCEMHQNTFGGRAPPGTGRGGNTASHPSSPLLKIRSQRLCIYEYMHTHEHNHEQKAGHRISSLFLPLPTSHKSTSLAA